MLRLSSSFRHRRTYRWIEGADGGTREIAYDSELTRWVAVELLHEGRRPTGVVPREEVGIAREEDLGDGPLRPNFALFRAQVIEIA